MISPTIPPINLDQPLLRILIVDDSLEVRHDLRQLLELSGLVVVVGEGRDGQEALQLVESLLPDVVVMDMEMPVMNGAEATRHIKKDQHALRVVILSVHNSPDVLDLAREAGADSFITKGAGYEILLNAILGMDGSNILFTKGDGL
jgi:DNA-binding NarL/FixJ family response regulator